MPSYSLSDLAQQLSRNSSPYHDPVAKVHWAQLDRDHYWLPVEALSLYGLPAFDTLSDAQRKAQSHYEFLNFIEAGLWLEAIFMERITRSLSSRQNRAVMHYRLHELREEAGHSLMFLELMQRSGLSLPHSRPPMRLMDLFARYAPLESLGFWMATVLGEEIPDRFNRYVRANGAAICPAIVEICTIHIVDEARHIAYAREMVEQQLAGLRSWQRVLLHPLLQILLRQFVQRFFCPPPALYELAGFFPGHKWAALARNNPHRVAFIDRCMNPTLQMLRSRGFAVAWH